MKFHKKTAREAEWDSLKKREARFLRQAMIAKPPVLNRKLEHFVPEKLGTALNQAFYKAFGLIFEKGTGVIEKTCHRENREMAYKVNAYAASLKENRKNLKAFSRNAKSSAGLNLLVSGTGGIGMGFLGIGLPDIPLFVGMILKSIYEIALSYGFPYDTPGEQCFILQVIRTSLMTGDEILKADQELNQSFGPGNVESGSDGIKIENMELEKKRQIRLTAESISNELMYTKFLQGIPIAGVVGGAYDAVYLKKITDYGEMKYRRRFLCRDGSRDGSGV